MGVDKLQVQPQNKLSLEDWNRLYDLAHDTFVRSGILCLVCCWMYHLKGGKGSWACTYYLAVQRIIGVFYPGLLVQT